MNVNQIMNMILRIFMRKAINKGINEGAKRMGGGRKQPGQSHGMQQAKKAARTSRKIGRM